jgi:Trp operon repressor
MDDLKLMLSSVSFQETLASDVATRIQMNSEFLTDDFERLVELFTSVSATENGADFLALLLGVSSLEDYYTEIVEQILEDEAAGNEID